MQRLKFECPEDSLLMGFSDELWLKRIICMLSMIEFSVLGFFSMLNGIERF
jgi:hypothetical protein